MEAQKRARDGAESAAAAAPDAKRARSADAADPHAGSGCEDHPGCAAPGAPALAPVAEGEGADAASAVGPSDDSATQNGGSELSMAAAEPAAGGSAAAPHAPPAATLAAAAAPAVSREYCTTCTSGDSLAGNEILLCDGLGCTKQYHQQCLSPPLEAIPADTWLCQTCVQSGNEVDPNALDPPGDMLQCGECFDRFHFSCLDKPLEARPDLWPAWRCLACKLCGGCNQNGTKIRLAICDVCDDGWHIGCLDPPLKSWPLKGFRCPKCVVCSSCGTTEAKAWAPGYRMCKSCDSLFKSKKYCPVCLVVHGKGENEMVYCDSCKFWVHARCDGLDKENLEELQNSEKEYSCPNCRGERTTTLMLQVLVTLSLEDREKFFAEPVTAEYALVTQYHNIVDEPMDFATMKSKVETGVYGNEMNSAVAAFRKDFELVCTNAMAFHRPNERCHTVAKRMLTFGNDKIQTIFPHVEPDKDGPLADKAEGETGKPSENSNQGRILLANDEVGADADTEAPLEISPWSHAAAISFEVRAEAEPADDGGDGGGGGGGSCVAGPAPPRCLVCGGEPVADSLSASEAELLECSVCAEAYHAFCCPPPCPTVNEETRLSWQCPRCRTCAAPKCGAGIDAEAETPEVTTHCAVCDKAVHNACLPPSMRDGRDGCAYWVCQECRCCQSCGTRTARAWSADGVWCATCATAGFEGRYCGICARVYDSASPEAAHMIQCDRCALWVHVDCDGMDDATYEAYEAGSAGHEVYECPDCQRGSAAPNDVALWRDMARLVSKIQQKRIQFSPELLPQAGTNGGLGIGIANHARRRAAVVRWAQQRALAAAKSRGLLGPAEETARLTKVASAAGAKADAPAPVAAETVGEAKAGAHGPTAPEAKDGEACKLEPADSVPDAAAVEAPLAADGPGRPEAEAASASKVAAAADDDEDSFNEYSDDEMELAAQASTGAPQPLEPESPAREGASALQDASGPATGDAALAAEAGGQAGGEVNGEANCKEAAPAAADAPAANPTGGSEAPPLSPAAAAAGVSSGQCEPSTDTGLAEAAPRPNGADGADGSRPGSASTSSLEGAASRDAPLHVVPTCASANGESEPDGEPASVDASGRASALDGAVSGAGSRRVCGFCGDSADAVQCGRMLPTGAGGWAHINCLLWSSEVFEKEAGVLHGVPAALRRARRTFCAHCQMPGASVGCNAKKCANTYHFACARAAGVLHVLDSASTTYCCAEHVPPRLRGLPLPLRCERSVRLTAQPRLQDVQRWPQAVGSAQRADLVIGALRVQHLGRPQPRRPQFHSRHAIYPLGFESRRRYHDVAVAHALCEYTCEVLDSAGLPWFVITREPAAAPVDASAAAAPPLCFKGRTAQEAWGALQARRCKLLHVRPPALSERRMALEAALFFGFGVPAVAQLIEQLPGAKACEGFQPRYSLAGEMQRVPPLPKSASGCARTDPVVRRSSKYKADRRLYFRPFINRGELPRERRVAAEVAAEEQLAEELREDTRVGTRKRDGERPLGQLERGLPPALRTAANAVEVNRSAIHNWGLFTTRPVPKDGMVVEYMGSGLRSSIADVQEKKYENGTMAGMGGDCYMFRLDEHIVLDATVRGNIARYMNHCCTPNCYSRVISVEGTSGADASKHIVIFAGRDLEEGEEVTYDYKFPVEKAKIACHCGSPKCLGVMN